MGSGVKFPDSRKTDQGILVEPAVPGRAIPPTEVFRNFKQKPERAAEGRFVKKTSQRGKYE